MSESRIMESLGPGEMSSTTGGNPLSCAAALAVLDIMEEERLPENALKIGSYMLERFKEFEKKYEILGEARGRGLVMGLEFVKDRKSLDPAPDITWEFILRCCEAGALVGRVGFYGNVIRIAPPLVMNQHEAEEAVDIVERVLKSF
jgi:4-aminobutyrate aminotransferase-like enzyme